MASVAQDETVARRAVHAALTVLQDSGLKADDPTIDWSRADFPEVRNVLTAARTAIRRTLLSEYHERQLRTTGWHGMIVDTPDLLLMSAMQAWLAGGNALSIHPFSATSYTWLAVSTFTAMRHMEDEYRELYLDVVEPDERGADA
jgi:hypothetical protein